MKKFTGDKQIITILASGRRSGEGQESYKNFLVTPELLSKIFLVTPELLSF